MKSEIETKCRSLAVNSWLIGMVMMLAFVSGCNEDEGTKEAVYALNETAGSGISGTITFRQKSSTTTLIIIQLEGTQSGDSHPAHIHANDAATGGEIVLDLTDVDGATGRSETTVMELNDGTEVNYKTLRNFDGYVNVHLIAADFGALIAQGNIGLNADPLDPGDY